jgi:hypothetical protein
MPKNKISDLRDHLFATLEALSDKEAPMELDRAKTICAVSKQVIDSAKVEVDYMRVVTETMGQTADLSAPFFGEGGRGLNTRALPAGKPNGGAH